MQTFEVFLLEYPIKVGTLGQWDAALRKYRELLHLMTDYFREHPEEDDGTKNTRKLYQLFISQSQIVSHREWEVIVRQAWYGSRQGDPKSPKPIISDQPNRLILPITSISFEQNGMITIYLAGVPIIHGDWLADETIWGDFAVIPGKFVAITKKIDAHGKTEFHLTVVAYRPVVDTARDLAGWLANDIDRQRRKLKSKRRHEYWIRKLESKPRKPISRRKNLSSI